MVIGFLGSFFADIGAMFGDWLGSIINVLLSAIALFLIWGLWWHIILRKAKFAADEYGYIMTALCLPVYLAFLADEVFRMDAQIVRPLIAIAGISVYIGVVAIALVPWPACKPQPRPQPKPKPPQVNNEK